MAGVLVYRPGRPLHRQLAFPRTCERRGIVNLELVQQSICVHQAEALDEMTVPIPSEVAAGNAAGSSCLIRLAMAETGADLHVTVDLADHHAKPEDLFPLPPLALRSTNLAMAIADYSDGHFYPLASKPPRTWSRS